MPVSGKRTLGWLAPSLQRLKLYWASVVMTAAVIGVSGSATPDAEIVSRKQGRGVASVQLPASMPMLEHHNGGTFPALESGVFRLEDGRLAVFVVNAGPNDLDFETTMDPARHGLAEDAVLDIDRISPSGQVTSIQRGATGPISLKDSLPCRTIAMYHVRAKIP